jgi:hypothetical protein
LRYVLAFLAAVAGLVVGWLAAAFATLALGGIFGLSDFEGQRAMMAFFAIGPAGGLAGLAAAVWGWLRYSRG